MDLSWPLFIRFRLFKNGFFNSDLYKSCDDWNRTVDLWFGSDRTTNCTLLHLGR